MHVAAQALVGQHDFTTFRAAECQAQSPVKTLDRLDVSRRGDEIHIEASARSFLHHQIRSFAGTLKLVGEGKWTPARCRGGAGGEGPRPLRPGLAAGWAVSGEGGLLGNWLFRTILTMAGPEPAIQGPMHESLLPWMGGSSPPMVSN